jgi:hypothetical protein
MPTTPIEFPAIGSVYEVNFGGDFVFRYRFDSTSSMTLVGVTGQFKGVTESLNVFVEPIRPGVFLVAWQEKARTTVVQVQDYERGQAFIAITSPDSSFLRLKGQLKELG